MRGLLSPLIKLTVFLIVTFLATYVLAATIANTSYGSTRTYSAWFSDASGLESGDDVRIAGVRVGSVDSIKLEKGPEYTKQKPQYLAKVTFSVAKSSPLPASVQVNLRYRNLVGQRYLAITQGTGSTKDWNPKQTIPEPQTHNAVDLTHLFQGFQPLFQGLDASSINTLSTEIIDVLQGEGSSITQLFETIASLTGTLNDKNEQIGELIDNLAQVLTNVGQRDTELSSLILELQSFISGLAQDRTTIGDAITGINNLTSTTSGLLAQVRAPLAKDVKDVTGLVNVLNANSGTVQYVIQNLAPTLGTLIRTASYGSWFNFYLCSVSGKLALPGGQILDLNGLSSPKARCQ